MNTDLSTALPPHDLEAEMALLGSMLRDPTVIADVAEIVRADDFYSKVNAILYDEIRKLNYDLGGVDVVQLGAVLKQLGISQETGGADYLIDLLDSVPSAVTAPHYADIVLDCSRRRQLAQLAGDLLANVHQDRRGASELADDASGKLFTMLDKSQRNSIEPIGDIAERVYSEMLRAHEKHERRGMPTGLAELDALLGGGFEAGRVYVVGGRPGMGKSALVQTFAQNLSAAGHPCGFFTLEMSPSQIASRSLASFSSWPLNDIRQPPENTTPEWWSNLHKSLGELIALKLFICDCPATTVEQLNISARRMIQRYGVKCLVIDYLQLMGGDGRRGRYEMVTNNSAAIKSMARSLNVTIVLVAQLNRAVESRTPPMPQLADLKESGGIEQDADAVLLLYRDDYYRKTKPGYVGPDNGLLVNVCKWRDGATGMVLTRFDGRQMRVTNWGAEAQPAWVTGEQVQTGLPI